MTDAKFFAWQIVPKGAGLMERGFNVKSYPMFIVLAPESPYKGSTVSDAKLRELGLTVPNYPSLEEWRAEQ